MVSSVLKSIKPGWSMVTSTSGNLCGTSWRQPSQQPTTAFAQQQWLMKPSKMCKVPNLQHCTYICNFHWIQFPLSLIFYRITWTEERGLEDIVQAIDKSQYLPPGYRRICSHLNNVEASKIQVRQYEPMKDGDSDPLWSFLIPVVADESLQSAQLFFRQKPLLNAASKPFT